MPVDRNAVLAWFAELARVYAANREHLTELDSAIGDADHGSNMDRGFNALEAELNKNTHEGIPAIFKTAAATLIKTVGGASGPLYGTFFLRAATACPDRPELDAADIAAIFRAGVEGIVQRGKASLEDATMGEMLANAASAAESGMRATIPLQARKGRASYLGPRSVGHQDPGATSAYLLIRAAADVWHNA